MHDAGVGRVLVASLHQGIADILPTRLAFYENWLRLDGLQHGTIGLAPLYAALSFLRQEGEAYQHITARAGEYAAEWTVQTLTPLERALVRAAPAWLRRRLVLRLARRVVRRSYAGSRAISRMRRGTASLDVRASIFCSVREPVAHPLCGFYAAALTRLMALFDLRAQTEVIACRGTGEPTCVLHVALPSHRQAGVLRVALGLLLLHLVPGSAQVAASRGVLVVPFENVKRDASIFWLCDLNRALYLAPSEADAHLLVGRLHLQNNRLQPAIDSFKIALWSAETAPAHVAPGEAYLEASDIAAARSEAERAATLDPSSNEARELLSRIAAR
jgi:tetratricopeptide (TPR) repeat protein